MITSLSIENFALIEKLNIDFSKGFSIITGETGAGKSILLGALGLVLGKRADLTSLKNKEEKCIVEANFALAKYDLQAFFDANDLDYEEETIIRREILPSGKSRAFVNDSPVNLQQLQDLSFYLIDVHSQHQTLELSEEEYQFKIIDAIADNQQFRIEYAFVLKQYRSAKTTLETKKSSLSAILKEKDYNEFLFNELHSANLKPGELEELEKTYEALNNVEFIKENLSTLLTLANEDQFGLLKNLKEFKSILQKNAGFSTEYESLFERANSVLIEFDDIVKELNRESDLVFNDPEKLELLNQKLQLIYGLQKKHQVQTVEELIDIQNELETKVVSVVTLEEEIVKLEKSLNDFEIQLDALAVKISQSRSEAIPNLSQKLIDILNLLGMPNVRFKIDITPSSTYYNNGKDSLQFLFSANKGTDFGLLKKVASGGEMSRIMLAVKSILSQYSKLPTIIFDEIDTGVSGEIANKMGEIMREMSQSMQVFAITHLPQIAAKGNTHYKVFKTVLGENTVSELKLLTNEERIIEIAEMLSGKDISDSALNHAKALLN
ncbi:DNA repair protein RecN [Flavobacterium sp. J49]|uniref:DNA repair protein RecN n=1 Tax=Flavobacterium sp. J49 TaxID=2718534 RepID=UPI0015947803|nr:DNA repair protein RecN [Flavobacterium sp. J49]MBF6640738.1 DNA repair protein RecN [Flavobacterium sp. J49]NIC01985.1 DNA repair protein RecN [Flavobacterium sp. J49]